MKLLLDTCTFLWIVAGAPELSDRARIAFTTPDNEVFLSAVSAWEIAVKHGLGRLPLPAPPSDFVPEMRRRHGIAELPLSEEAVLFLGKLPANHRDPFDRMLICQATVEGLVLLTPDEQIASYPVRTLW
jgi:PIN domain nuclease of toxin-antitoxin system